MQPHGTKLQRLFLTLVFALTAVPLALAGPVLGPWVPIFKGIDHAVGTNSPTTADFPNLQVIHALRIDLSDPDITLFSTPRISSYAAESRETAGRTVSDFLRTYHLQAAVNANFFNPQDYYLPAGTPMDVAGLAISQGVLVSKQEGAAHSASVLFTTNNQASIIFTNWPAHSPAGIYTAISGTYPLVINGANIGRQYLSNPDTIHDPNPRTAFGLSQDRRYLYILTIDGRQPGYSEGAYDYETGGWLLLLGVYDGVNMDGGGSTTLIVEDSTGRPLALNHSSAVADSGRERTVGSHFGVFAKPVPAFINDIVAIPDDTSATISWTTIEPSTTQVQYDVTTDLTTSTALDQTLVTNHMVLVTGLTPETGYYFKAVSTTGAATYASSNLFFTTTNYVTTNQIFEVTNSWRYAATNLDGVDWTAPSYDDSGWDGSGAGLLWVDVRATGPNPAVDPKNTLLSADPDNNGFPYPTYYFRTHFPGTLITPGTTLLFSSYVDDGAVFYLNGAEIYRLRMDAAPMPISNSSLALGYPCAGDATCPDEFSVSGDALANALPGDNVLAVEVHNYNLLSADITFGTALAAKVPTRPVARLAIAQTGQGVTLSWDGSGFVLQQAEQPNGPWSDVTGSAVTSPVFVQNSGGPLYFRLKR